VAITILPGGGDFFSAAHAIPMEPKTIAPIRPHKTQRQTHIKKTPYPRG
jgi:hypothetical protein